MLFRSCIANPLHHSAWPQAVDEKTKKFSRRLRIFVALYQILGTMANTYLLRYPPMYTSALAYTALLQVRATAIVRATRTHAADAHHTTHTRGRARALIFPPCIPRR